MNEIISHLVLIVCLVGGILYIVCSRKTNEPYLAEIGRLMFFVGLLAVLLK